MLADLQKMLGLYYTVTRKIGKKFYWKNLTHDKGMDWGTKESMSKEGRKDRVFYVCVHHFIGQGWMRAERRRGLKRWTVMNHLKNCTQEPCPGWGGLGMKVSSYSVVLGRNQTTSPTTRSQLYREGPPPLLWPVKNLLEYLPWQKCFIPKKQSSAK